MCKISFSIRTATLADIDSIDTLCALVSTLHSDALPNLFKPSHSALKNRAFLETLIAGPASAIFVAVKNSEALGFLIVLDKHVQAGPVTIERRYAEIDNMAVALTARRNGIGRALIQAAATWAKSRGISALELNVYNFNDSAAALYQSSGFTTVYRRMNCPI